ncbi:hypothetical protein PoB_006630700 [Plakobranchus ocellatus]|uniref:Uncharacterized protein n=1 Tax=Plakobranchus ocellatus TaxID=259542 RepID=A0AAV4D6R4_9GAST|nr:hypothetical protein PoB_006630700 [Plakobranchus ocellatus]
MTQGTVFGAPQVGQDNRRLIHLENDHTCPGQGLDTGEQEGRGRREEEEKEVEEDLDELRLFGMIAV